MNPDRTGIQRRQFIGLLSGAAVFLLVLVLPRPGALSPEAHRAGAIALLMAVWWISEALPIAATALVPLTLYPLFSVLPMDQTASRYADPNVFLFMGGFMIAMAMQKWNLHKRLALLVIGAFGGGPRRLMAGFMIATAFLSMWISNTATAVMMLPIGMAVIGQVAPQGREGPLKNFGFVLMLGIAYSASVGGVSTLIGTPPNIIFAGQAKTLFPELGEVGFVRWMLFAFPIAWVFLVFIWAYLTFGVGRLPAGSALGRDVVKRELEALGPWTSAERCVLAVFLMTAFCWMTRADLKLGPIFIPGWSTLLGMKGAHDGTVAITGALLLFLIPVKRERWEFLLDWNSAARLPWGVLLLFGGGFALAESFHRTGLDLWIGGLFQALAGLPIWLIVYAVCVGTALLTEMTSNTATATMLMPVLAAGSGVLDIHPYFLMIPATISASFAFMLPVATPPNAIIFGSGCVTVPRMVRAGSVLFLTGAIWNTAMTFLLTKYVFGF